MKDFYFVFSDDCTGEDFIVNARGFRLRDALLAAQDIASGYFSDPHYEYEVDERQAEWLGYDVY